MVTGGGKMSSPLVIIWLSNLVAQYDNYDSA